jgi:hypothetical protein
MMLLCAAMGFAAAGPVPDLKGYQFLVTSVRTGDTEIFLVDPTYERSDHARRGGGDLM